MERGQGTHDRDRGERMAGDLDRAEISQIA